MQKVKRYKQINGERVQVEYNSPEQIRYEEALELSEKQKAQDSTNSPDALQKYLEELQQRVARLEKQQINIIGDFDGTNVQVSIHGIRRKIATTAPW